MLYFTVLQYLAEFQFISKFTSARLFQALGKFWSLHNLEMLLSREKTLLLGISNSEDWHEDQIRLYMWKVIENSNNK